MAKTAVKARRHGNRQRAVHQARLALLDDTTCGLLAESFAALSEPNRVKIIYSLLGRELCVGDLAAILGISESGVSQHLRILRSLRWVRNRKEGRLVYYFLNDEHVRDLLDIGLKHSVG